jgi:hypothetical protein
MIEEKIKAFIEEANTEFGTELKTDGSYPNNWKGSLMDGGSPDCISINEPGQGHVYIDRQTGEIVTKLDRPWIATLRKRMDATPRPERQVEEETTRQPRSVQPDAIKIPSPMKGFRPAKRSKAKLRLALTGPAGSGKTASALLIARGLTDSWENIGMVDTEAGSGELYVGSMMGDTKIGAYNVLPLEAPYTPSRYIEAIKLAEEAGLDVLIIDSLSHAWEGEGGVLEMHDLATMASKSQNSYFAWRDVTPQHKALIDKILTSKIHIIATMRTKTEYVLGEKNTPHKVGLAPIQRAGTDYEFGVVFELSQQHVAIASKDRTNLFDGLKFKPTIETGEMLLKWLEEES